MPWGDDERSLLRSHSSAALLFCCSHIDLWMRFSFLTLT